MYLEQRADKALNNGHGSISVSLRACWHQSTVARKAARVRRLGHTLRQPLRSRAGHPAPAIVGSRLSPHWQESLEVLREAEGG